jgi:hypothetical protein
MRVIEKPTLPNYVSDWHAFPEQVNREARAFDLPQAVGSEEARFGYPSRWPPSAAQTGRADFPHPAFMRMPIDGRG